MVCLDCTEPRVNTGSRAETGGRATLAWRETQALQGGEETSAWLGLMEFLAGTELKATLVSRVYLETGEATEPRDCRDFREPLGAPGVRARSEERESPDILVLLARLVPPVLLAQQEQEVCRVCRARQASPSRKDCQGRRAVRAQPDLPASSE